VAAPAVAWPTMLMPVEYALITQFAAFTFLYFADARATVRGWAPPWYSTYRFVLTFVVGASIVVSLIGREQIAFKGGNMPGVADRLKELKESQRLAQAEEQVKLERMAATTKVDQKEENDGAKEDENEEKKEQEESGKDEKE
jgi:hypothetical protein